MSWYSKIYTAVRDVRSHNPILGWILTKCLNLLLIFQLLVAFLSYYTFFNVTVGYYVTNNIQATFYIIFTTYLLTMSIWSLTKTLMTPIARVPQRYRPSKDLVDRLKSVTPFENDRYVVEKSTFEQTREQNMILEEMCRQCGVRVAECDQLGRIKFCYECLHIKPDRCRHCSSCGECTVKYDHHCPWINMCVNHANYKYFLLYVVYTTALAYWYMLTSLEGVFRYFLIQKWKEDSWKLFVYLITCIPAAIFGYYPLGELIMFHWQLISLNETTVEQTKPAVLRNDNLADYNMGREANFSQVFGWGLWMFPIESSEHDGLHYDIRYVSDQKVRYVKVLEGSERSNMSEVIDSSIH